MDTAKPRILVVEDEAAIRDGLADVLVYHGYSVDAVGDGRDGLQKALSGQYDLLLLDVMLPGRDGFAICDEVRKVDRDQPIIMLTAKTSDEDIVNGLVARRRRLHREAVLDRAARAASQGRAAPLAHGRGCGARRSSSPATSRSTCATCRAAAARSR